MNKNIDRKGFAERVWDWLFYIVIIFLAVSSVALWLDRDRAIKEGRRAVMVEVKSEPAYNVVIRYDEGLIKIDPDRLRENIKKAIADSVRK